VKLFRIFSHINHTKNTFSQREVFTITNN